MPSEPHRCRQELDDLWRSFLSGVADRATVAEYIDERIADYGPDELIHDGLQLLNDDLLDSGNGKPISRVRHDTWLAELRVFDADPAGWNRTWALAYAEGVLPKLRPQSRRAFLKGISEKLTKEDLDDLFARFVAP